MSALAIFRGFDDLLLFPLFGVIVFRALVLPRELRDAVDPSRALARLLALSALVIGIALFVARAADMAESWRLQDLLTVLTATDFGHRIAAALALLAATCALLFAQKPALAALTVAGALICRGMTGHVGAQGDPAAVALELIHLFAVSLWAGGLISLSLWLRSRPAPGTPFRVVSRFSKLAAACVALIASAGVLLAYREGVTIPTLSEPGPDGPGYGQVLLVKSLLFGTALGFASVNHFIHLRRFKAEGEDRFTRGVRRGVMGELILLGLVFLVAGVLASLSPK